MAFLILHWAFRSFLAGIFLYSGYIKTRSPLQFAKTIADYQLVPMSFVLPIAQYLPWIEIALGVLLLAGWKLRYFAFGSAGLLSLFIAAMAITYFRGIEADCGCFGPGEKISLLTLGRDLLFMVPAVFLALDFPRAERKAAEDQPIRPG